MHTLFSYWKWKTQRSSASVFLFLCLSSANTTVRWLWGFFFATHFQQCELFPAQQRHHCFSTMWHSFCLHTIAHLRTKILYFFVFSVLVFFWKLHFGVFAVAVWPCLDCSSTGSFYGLKNIDLTVTFFGLSFEVTVGLTSGSICLWASLDVLTICLRFQGQWKK